MSALNYHVPNHAAAPQVILTRTRKTSDSTLRRTLKAADALAADAYCHAVTQVFNPTPRKFFSRLAEVVAGKFVFDDAVRFDVDDRGFMLRITSGKAEIVVGLYLRGSEALLTIDSPRPNDRASVTFQDPDVYRYLKTLVASLYEQAKPSPFTVVAETVVYA